MINKFLKNFNIHGFRQDLIDWYEKNKRQLPWRMDRDPYKVWVSEIMLQQTRVDTVIPYFENFMNKFPTVFDLAKADEQEVLKAWEGLGYYSRARNLHSAVKEVVATYDGHVPSNGDELGRLKGIGPYTKGAILSIAFNQAEPAVDGNVMRVLSRILKIEENIAQHRTKNLFEKVTAELIDHEKPSSFNQGLMELGALVCTPKSPTCLICPVNEYCRAFAEGIEEELPFKSKAKKQPTIPYISLLIHNQNNEIIIEQRPKKGLLANLWQFPMIQMNELGLDHVEYYFYSEYGLNLKLMEKKGKIKHVFSHLIWQIDIYEATIPNQTITDQRLRVINMDELDQYPFPVPHQKMMKYLSHKRD